MGTSARFLSHSTLDIYGMVDFTDEMVYLFIPTLFSNRKHALFILMCCQGKHIFNFCISTTSLFQIKLFLLILVLHITMVNFSHWLIVHKRLFTLKYEVSHVTKEA